MAKANTPAQGGKSPKDTADAKDAGTSSASKAGSKSGSSKAPAGKAEASAGKAAAKTDPKSSPAPADAPKAKAEAAKTSEAKVSDAKPANAKTGEPKAADTKADDPKSNTVPAANKDTAKAADAPSKPAPSDTAAKPQPAASPRPSPAPAAPPQRSVFWPFVLGGVVAAGLGFVASEMNVLNTRVDTVALRADLSAQQEAIDALAAQEAPEAPDLSGLEQALADLTTLVEDVETRLAALEARPVVAAPTGDDDSGEASAALAELQASVAAQRDEITRLLENAQSVEAATAEAARKAQAQAALAEITAALAEGAPFADAAASLEDAGVDLPSGLSDVAGSGAPALTMLQTDFPDAARASLTAARDAGLDGEAGGLGGFLKRQLGARSVAPREGDDPDAILSRAEAALRAGDLGAALAEIDALPEDVQSAMQSWLEPARARAGADAAVQDLSQSLTAN